MEKYRRVRPAREPLGSDEIRVQTSGSVASYLGYANTLITEKNMKHLTIKASGNAIGQAIAIAEQIKRRYKGLHQINKCGNSTVTTVFEPLEEGLDQVTQERVVAFMEIKLSFEPLDEKDPGYQPPLDDSARIEIPIPGPRRPMRGRGGYMGMRRRGGPRKLAADDHEGEAAHVESGNANDCDINGQTGDAPEFRGRGRGRGGYRGGFRGYGFRGGRGGRGGRPAQQN